MTSPALIQVKIDHKLIFVKNIIIKQPQTLTNQDGIYIINWSMICICSIIPTKDGTFKEIERLIWRPQP